jgi:leader peptidase (prepilin peptidase)/N-methyltransferase
VTEIFFTIELAVLGLVIGSFLNVVIARVPNDESIVRPGSKCPKCSTPISWYDNVPVLSWVLLRGKCRHCKAPISPRYVFVELITATLFLACLKRFGWTWDLAMALTFVTILVPLIFIDAEHWILPFELTVPGIVLGLLLRIPLGWAGVVVGLIGAGSAYVAFRIMEYVGWLFARREALGAGDKFLLALIGAFMGWRPLLGIVALSSLQGAVFGILRIVATGRAAAEMAPAADDGTKPPESGSSADQAGAESEEADDELTFTPDVFRPGLSFGRRLLLIPWTLFLQPIPDEPEAEEGEAEPEWVPGATNLPFGPWIALAALELLLLGPWVAAHAGDTLWSSMLRMMFGT